MAFKVSYKQLQQPQNNNNNVFEPRPSSIYGLYPGIPIGCLQFQDCDKEGTLRLTRPFKTHLIGSLGTLTRMNYTAKTSFHVVAL